MLLEVIYGGGGGDGGFQVKEIRKYDTGQQEHQGNIYYNTRNYF